MHESAPAKQEYLVLHWLTKASILQPGIPSKCEAATNRCLFVKPFCKCGASRRGAVLPTTSLLDGVSASHQIRAPHHEVPVAWLSQSEPASLTLADSVAHEEVSISSSDCHIGLLGWIPGAAAWWIRVCLRAKCSQVKTQSLQMYCQSVLATSFAAVTCHVYEICPAGKQGSQAGSHHSCRAGLH